MSERFFHSGSLERHEVVLESTEAHHLAHVLRLGPGSIVTLFDGEGREAAAEVVAVAKRGVTLRPGEVRNSPPPTTIPITIAVSPPKGDRFRWLVEKATELGAAGLVPLLTRRTVVDPREGKLDKLRQTVIAACKQCGRSRLMAIAEAEKFEKFSAKFSREGNQRERLLILHPGGPPLGSVSFAEEPAGATLLIGPEGGFTDEEVEQAVATGAQRASLGRMILRTETAAIAAIAVAAQTLAAKG